MDEGIYKIDLKEAMKYDPLVGPRDPLESANKIEINVGSLSKEEKRIWVKPTSKRKGHYRRVKGAKKVEEVAEKTKVSEMIQDNVKSVLTLNDLGIKGGAHDEDTYILEFKNGDYGIFKKMASGRIFGEVSTYEVNKIIDWDIVPETVSGDFGKGNGSIQKWIENGVSPGDDTKLTEDDLNGLSKIYLMDMALGCRDRHEGNVILEGGNVYAIDNEFLGSISASEYLNVLDNRILGSSSGYSPLMRWLDDGGDIFDIYTKFKFHLMNNMVDITNKKFEILEYFKSHIDEEIAVGMGMALENAISNIEENLDCMRKYYDTNI